MPLSYTANVLLPVGLCSLVLLGTKLSPTVVIGGESLAPTSVPQAYQTLAGLPGYILPMAMLHTLGRISYEHKAPAAIPTLAEYLQVARIMPELPVLARQYNVSIPAAKFRPCPPFDGTVLAVAPDTPAVRRLMEERVLAGPLLPPHHVIKAADVERFRAERAEQEAGGQARWHTDELDRRMAAARAARAANALAQERGAEAARVAAAAVPPVPIPSSFGVRYFQDADEIDRQARDGLGIWAAAVFDSVGESRAVADAEEAASASATWSYALRFPKTLNRTSVPSSRRVDDKFARGFPKARSRARARDARAVPHAPRRTRRAARVSGS